MEATRAEWVESIRPECAVCLLPYDDGSRTPRLLFCGHSISQDCADLLIDSNYSPAGEAYAGFGRNGPPPQDNATSSRVASVPPEGLGKLVGARFGVVKCPECNQRTKVPANGARGLAKNIELLRVISKLQGNDGSAKARKADLERNVNWAREIATHAEAVSLASRQEGVSGSGSEQRTPGAVSSRGRGQSLPASEGSGRMEVNEEIQSAAESISSAASGLAPQGPGSSSSDVYGSAQEASPGNESVSSTAPSVDTLRSAFRVGGRQQIGNSPEQSGTAGTSSFDAGSLQRRGSSPPQIPQDFEQNGSVAVEASASENGNFSLIGKEELENANPPSDEEEPGFLTSLHSVLPGHQDSVSALAIVADQWLCSASFDRTVRVWSISDGSPHGLLEGHQHRIMALATVSLPPEESTGVDENGIVCGNGRIIDNYVGGPEITATIPQGADLLVSADYGGHIKVWSVIRDTSIFQGQGESPEGGEDKPGVSQGEPSPGPGKLLASWDAHADWKYFGVLALAVADGKVLYSGAGDRTIRAWSLGAGGVAVGGLLGVLEGHTGPVSALVVDGELLYSGSWDGSVRGWWREDHTPVAVVHAGPGPGVRCLSMVGPRLIAGRDDGTLQAWVEGQPESEKGKAHEGVVSTMCNSGPFLYTGSWDGVIHVWRADMPFGTEAPLASIQVEGGPLAVVHALAAARGQLFSAHLDTAIKVWTYDRI